MIKDPKDVDLTIDMKFYKRVDYKKESALIRLKGSVGRDSSLPSFLGSRSKLLPWNTKHILKDADLGSYRVVRNNGDSLSDDFGQTLRLVSNNKIWVIGEKLKFKEVLEEFLLEALGGIPYEPFIICPWCGKKKLNSYRIGSAWMRYGTCPNCKGRLPWREER